MAIAANVENFMSSSPERKITNPFENSIEVTEPIRDAASIVLIRAAPDGAAGLQAFMLRRSRSTTVMNSAYVFPGGKVDAEDASEQARQKYAVPANAAIAINEAALTPEQAAALYVAACRECEEECGVSLAATDLTPFSRWITPKVPAMMRRRFDTRFFLACLPDGAHAVHDGVEADASEWMSPRQAIGAYCEGQITLAPPQLMTLSVISRFANYEALTGHLEGHQAPLIEPFPFKELDGARSIAYPGDPEHPISKPAFPGPTRLVWRDNHFEPPEGIEALF